MSGLGKELPGGLFVDKEILKDWRRVKKILALAAVIAGATVISKRKRKFPKPPRIGAYNVAIVIAESHIIGNVNPEDGFMQLDVFTCGDQIDPQVAVDYIAKELGSVFLPDSDGNRRGVLSVGNEPLPHKACAATTSET